MSRPPPSATGGGGSVGGDGGGGGVRVNPGSTLKGALQLLSNRSK